MTRVQLYGSIVVPWTVSWSTEERIFVGRCWLFKEPALMQPISPGKGKPEFGKPHSQRQREAVVRCLCDICGRSIRNSTKVSLSHARPVPHGAQGWAILQVEPMMHRECAAKAITQCPSLKRDIELGTLEIRQVFKWRSQAAIMDEVYVESVTGERRKALGHAKVELQAWTDRDQAWLERREAA